jgi:flagellar protein FlaG
VMLIIAGVIASLAVFNGVYPAITDSSGAISSATTKVSDRIESRIDIIQVGDNGTDVYVWIKNIGGSNIDDIDSTDLFFGPEGDFYSVPCGGGSAPYWEYELEGSNSRWKPTVTLKITIHPAEALTAGSYYLKAVIPNGISAQTTYSVE